jgi:hypothetical protein
MDGNGNKGSVYVCLSMIDDMKEIISHHREDRQKLSKILLLAEENENSKFNSWEGCFWSHGYVFCLSFLLSGPGQHLAMMTELNYALIPFTIDHLVARTTSLGYYTAHRLFLGMPDSQRHHPSLLQSY